MEWQSADTLQRFATHAIERYVKKQFSRRAATSKMPTCSAIGLAESHHPLSVESHVPRSSVRAWFRLRGSTHRRRTSRSCRISVQCRIGLQLMMPFMTPPFGGLEPKSGQSMRKGIVFKTIVCRHCVHISIVFVPRHERPRSTTDTVTWNLPVTTKMRIRAEPKHFAHIRKN